MSTDWELFIRVTAIVLAVVWSCVWLPVMAIRAANGWSQRKFLRHADEKFHEAIKKAGHWDDLVEAKLICLAWRRRIEIEEKTSHRRRASTATYQKQDEAAMRWEARLKMVGTEAQTLLDKYPFT